MSLYLPRTIKSFTRIDNVYPFWKTHLGISNLSDQGDLVDWFGNQRKIHYNININKRLAQFVALWYQVET